MSFLKPSFPAPQGELPELSSPAATLWARLRSAWGGVSVTRRTRRLRLCESLPLGEKRLLALVECEGQRLLLAVTAGQIALLERLGTAEEPSAAGPQQKAGRGPEARGDRP